MKYFLVLLVFSLVFVGLTQSADARGPDEPCSYLKPTKYIKDSSGNCILAPQNTVSNVAPATAPTHTTTIIHAPTPVPAATSSTANLSDVGAIALLGIFALIAYKIFGDRLRHPRIKYRPRAGQKPENFVDNAAAVEDNSAVSDSAGNWNGGFYDDNTKERFK